jgi:hypothetical protein
MRIFPCYGARELWKSSTCELLSREALHCSFPSQRRFGGDGAFDDEARDRWAYLACGCAGTVTSGCTQLPNLGFYGNSALPLGAPNGRRTDPVSGRTQRTRWGAHRTVADAKQNPPLVSQGVTSKRQLGLMVMYLRRTGCCGCYNCPAALKQYGLVPHERTCLSLCYCTKLAGQRLSFPVMFQNT